MGIKNRQKKHKCLVDSVYTLCLQTSRWSLLGQGQIEQCRNGFAAAAALEPRSPPRRSKQDQILSFSVLRFDAKVITSGFTSGRQLSFLRSRGAYLSVVDFKPMNGAHFNFFVEHSYLDSCWLAGKNPGTKRCVLLSNREDGNDLSWRG